MSIGNFVVWTRHKHDTNRRFCRWVPERRGSVRYIGRPPMMGMQGQDTELWFDVYAGRQPAPPVVMLHKDFLRCLDESGGTAGAWSRSGDYINLTANGVNVVYRFTGYETAGGFSEVEWPD